jgi:hypothetical protein
VALGPSPAQARQELVSFLGELREFLPSLLDSHPHWFADELRDELRAIWNEELPRSFETAIAELTGAVPPTGQPPTQLDNRLQAAGLSGRMLGIKLSGFRRALGRFYSERTKRWFHRAARWANVILGSLAGIVGGAEAIKEFKETFEAAAERE